MECIYIHFNPVLRALYFLDSPSKNYCGISRTKLSLRSDLYSTSNHGFKIEGRDMLQEQVPTPIIKKMTPIKIKSVALSDFCTTFPTS